MSYKAIYPSPIGSLEISGSPRFLSDCLVWLDGYFNKKKKFLFRIPALSGTSFQRKVWKALLGLKFGETVSYAEIARRVGHPKAVRACASAIKANPLAILFPCHRVIAKDGKMAGYAYGIWRKKWLLRHERS
jgi:methylated-DNA-[protein]-cysteine S-methyltransferase